MSLRDRFSRWRRQPAGGKQGELREFVYLDEISVFSLISSRLGSVATDYTATASTSSAGELAGSTGVSAGVFKTELKGRNEASQTQGTQVLRKATVQATFKELYDLVETELLLRPTTSGPPDLSAAKDLSAALEGACSNGWAMRARDIARGQLIEVAVDLEAEDIFRVGAVVEAFVDLFKEVPEALGPDVREQLAQAVAVNSILNKLLGGLVPVRGRAIDYVSVRTAEAEWVLHRTLQQPLRDRWGVESCPLDIVAVAELSLFWKDIRRVLFSGSRYSLLCRIGRNGLHDSWTPVKLVDVVREFVPELAKQIGAAGKDLVGAVNVPRPTSSTNAGNHAKMREALNAYGQSLATQYGLKWDSSLVTVDVLPEDPTRTWITVEEQRPPFAALTQRLQEGHGKDPDPDLIATLRHQALSQVGLVPLIRPAGAPHRAGASPPRAGSETRILDTELIAIYW